MGSKDYGGIVSSHSWSTPDSFPEIYKAGGFIAPYAGGSEGFVHAWQDTKPLRDKRFFFGFGYGADANGFGAQGGPRDPALAPPVRYPFRSFDGSVELQQQRSGERVYDINMDGVAHYGLYPDWIEDLRMIAGDAIVKDMGRGAEAYLQMWERADGVPGPDCRSTHARFTGGGLGELRLGDAPKQVLKRAGQPEKRTRTWKWCVDGRRNKGVIESAVFTPGGKVGLAGTTARSHRALGVTVGADIDDLGKRAEAGRRRPLRRRARQVEGGLRRARRQGRLHRRRHTRDRGQDQDPAALPEALSAVGVRSAIRVHPSDPDCTQRVQPPGR